MATTISAAAASAAALAIAKCRSAAGQGCVRKDMTGRIASSNISRDRGQECSASQFSNPAYIDFRQFGSTHSVGGRSPPLVSRRVSRSGGASARHLTRSTVASSEFWYEDEQDIGHNEIIRPKRFVLVRTGQHFPPPDNEVTESTAAEKGKDSTFKVIAATHLSSDGRQQALDALVHLHKFQFQAAFSSPEPSVIDFANILWDGRGGPPYFRKVRQRAVLGPPDDEFNARTSSSHKAIISEAQSFLDEMTTNNWNTELMDGLGQLTENLMEEVLVVTHKYRLLAILASAQHRDIVDVGQQVFPGSVTILDYSGHNSLIGKKGYFQVRHVNILPMQSAAVPLERKN